MSGRRSVRGRVVVTWADPGSLSSPADNHRPSTIVTD